MAVLKNRVGVVTSTVGTGNLALGAPLGLVSLNTASWQDFSAAGVTNGNTVRYLILDANGEWEYGPGIYSTSGPSLTRAVGSMSGSVAGQKSSTGALLNLSGAAQVFIAAVAEDLVPFDSPTFTGNPQAPTPSPGDNDTSIATTAFVQNAISSTPIPDGSVTDAKLADMPSPTFKARVTAGTGDPENITPTQATAQLNLFTSILKGLAPGSGGGTSNFLRADGSWAAPPGGGGGSSVSISDTPPGSPAAGDMWWESDTGTLWIYYNDGTSSQWVVAAGGSGSDAGLTPHAGQLTYVSATALKFAPLGGNKLKVNGALFTIPNAGIAGLANTSVFVNGTAGQNLAANTTYYVYAFSNSGVLTGDFRTDGNGHITDTTTGNEGVEVRCSTGTTPDPTRTLIGLIRTNASSQFVDIASLRTVRSWFNRRQVRLDGGTLNNATTGSTAPIATPLTVDFLIWSNEVADVCFVGRSYNTNVTANIVQLYLDAVGSGTDTSSYTQMSIAGANYQAPCAVSRIEELSEGFHNYKVYVWVAAGTGTFNGGLQGTIR